MKQGTPDLYVEVKVLEYRVKALEERLQHNDHKSRQLLLAIIAGPVAAVVTVLLTMLLLQ